MSQEELDVDERKLTAYYGHMIGLLPDTANPALFRDAVVSWINRVWEARDAQSYEVICDMLDHFHAYVNAPK